VLGRGLSKIRCVHYNKHMSKIRAALDLEIKRIRKKNAKRIARGEKQRNGEEYPVIHAQAKLQSKHLGAFIDKRNRKVALELHSVSADITRVCQQTGVKEVVIGWSDGFKNKPRMGRRNNQNFTCLPLAKLRDLTALKLRKAGIHVTISEEAYTSKASSLDGDVVPAYNEKPKGLKFSGTRISRGRYRTRDHGIIHADVNGAWNIIRKSNHDLVVGNGIVVMPLGRVPKWRPRPTNRERYVF